MANILLGYYIHISSCAQVFPLSLLFWKCGILNIFVQAIFMFMEGYISNCTLCDFA